MEIVVETPGEISTNPAIPPPPPALEFKSTFTPYFSWPVQIARLPPPPNPQVPPTCVLPHVVIGASVTVGIFELRSQM